MGWGRGQEGRQQSLPCLCRGTAQGQAVMATGPGVGVSLPGRLQTPGHVATGAVASSSPGPQLTTGRAARQRPTHGEGRSSLHRQPGALSCCISCNSLVTVGVKEKVKFSDRNKCSHRKRAPGGSQTCRPSYYSKQVTVMPSLEGSGHFLQPHKRTVSLPPRGSEEVRSAGIGHRTERLVPSRLWLKNPTVGECP